MACWVIKSWNKQSRADIASSWGTVTQVPSILVSTIPLTWRFYLKKIILLLAVLKPNLSDDCDKIYVNITEIKELVSWTGFEPGMGNYSGLICNRFIWTRFISSFPMKWSKLETMSWLLWFAYLESGKFICLKTINAVYFHLNSEA